MQLRKKLIMLLTALLMSLTAVCFADGGMWIASDYPNPDPPLYGKYPFIGADEPSAYYADPSSYYATSDGNIAHLGCMFYRTGGGAAPDGGPAHLTPYTVEFETYMDNGKRKVSCIVMNKNRQLDSACSYLMGEHRFMNYLFTVVANGTWIGKYL